MALWKRHKCPSTSNEPGDKQWQHSIRDWAHSNETFAIYISGLIIGLRPANERRRYKATPSHWPGANLESTLYIQCETSTHTQMAFFTFQIVIIPAPFYVMRGRCTISPTTIVESTQTQSRMIFIGIIIYPWENGALECDFQWKGKENHTGLSCIKI